MDFTQVFAIFLSVIMWFGLCFLVAHFWEYKGYNYASGWWLSFFFSPLIGYLIGLGLRDLKPLGGSSMRGYSPQSKACESMTNRQHGGPDTGSAHHSGGQVLVTGRSTCKGCRCYKGGDCLDRSERGAFLRDCYCRGIDKTPRLCYQALDSR